MLCLSARAMLNPCSTRLSGQAAWSGLKPVWRRQAAEFKETGVRPGACHPLTFRSPDSAHVSTSASSPGSSASQPSRPNRLLAGNLRDRNCSNPWAASSQRSTCTACGKSPCDAHAHHRALLPCGMSCSRAQAAQKIPVLPGMHSAPAASGCWSAAACSQSAAASMPSRPAAAGACTPGTACRSTCRPSPRPPRAAATSPWRGCRPAGLQGLMWRQHTRTTCAAGVAHDETTHRKSAWLASPDRTDGC